MCGEFEQKLNPGDPELAVWHVMSHGVVSGSPSRKELGWLERAVLHRRVREVWLGHRQRVLKQDPDADLPEVRASLAEGLCSESVREQMVRVGFVECYARGCEKSCRQEVVRTLVVLLHEPSALRRFVADVGKCRPKPEWVRAEKDPRGAGAPGGPQEDAGRCPVCGQELPQSEPPVIETRGVTYTATHRAAPT